MSKPVLVYVGHSYHQLTASSNFMLELLERQFQVHKIWDESWQPGGALVRSKEINAFKPDAVLFWQTIPVLRELRRIRCKRQFVAPMYDYVIGNPLDAWRDAGEAGLRVLSYCRATHELFVGLGYESICVKYWPKPAVEQVDSITRPRIFFWPRHQAISWSTLKSLLGSVRPERIVIRVAADPGQIVTMPSPADVSEYNIQIVEGWLEKRRYLKLLAECNVFMAPRMYEGIGLSFLEAMSHGLAVVAPNTPTMNEYIQHGLNGYLYSPQSPEPLDFSTLGSIRARAVAGVKVGYGQWLAEQEQVIAYFASKKKYGASIAWRIRRFLRR